MDWLAASRERRAASWLARMGNEGAAFDRAKFERWRNRSAGNARAFDEMATIWRMELPVADTSFAQGAKPVPARSSRLIWSAIAAVLVAAIGAAFLGSGRIAERGAPAETHVETASGQTTRILRLADGSVVTLAPSAVLHIAMSTSARAVNLVAGRARFDVAHDPTRPFSVRAGGGVVTAHGTLFDVSVNPRGVDVALIRGSVEVAPTDARTASVMLRPGERVRITAGGRVGPVETEKLGTPAGMLDFEQTTLTEAVAAFNRRNGRSLVVRRDIGDAVTVTGSFRADDPAAFAAMVADMFDLTVAPGVSGTVELRWKPPPRK